MDENQEKSEKSHDEKPAESRPLTTGPRPDRTNRGGIADENQEKPEESHDERPAKPRPLRTRPLPDHTNVVAAGEQRRRTKRHRILAGALAASIAGVFAIVTALIATDWFPQMLGFRIDEIRVSRNILYARILYFRDREKGQDPIMEKEVGVIGSKFRETRKIYDEGLYMSAYYLTPHTREGMTVHAHSSGVHGHTLHRLANQDHAASVYAR